MGHDRSTDGKVAGEEDIRRPVPTKTGNDASGIKAGQPVWRGPVPAPMGRADAAMAAIPLSGGSIPRDEPGIPPQLPPMEAGTDLHGTLTAIKGDTHLRGGNGIRRDYRNT